MTSRRRKIVVILSKTANFTAWSVGCFVLGAVTMGYYKVFESGKALKALHVKQNPFKSAEYSLIESEAKRRFSLYEKRIEASHLVNGMVVNRDVTSNTMKEECDSLLFSSLRYVALRKMGYNQEARKAWKAIKKVIQGERIMRHPQCQKPPSRDMVLGLLAALTMQPEDGREVFVKVMNILEKNRGFFTSQRTHYSFLTPQIAQIAKQVAQLYHLPTNTLPKRVKKSFSTHELDSLLTRGGYRTHLISLTVWVELEIIEQLALKSKPLQTNSVVQTFESFSGNITGSLLEYKRLQFVAQRLIDVDPRNLFYRYLRLKTENLLNPAANQNLLYELVNLPQFPKGALPMNCDRHADYLWMRHSRESTFKSGDCSKRFPGVDYLWLSSLLLEKSTLKKRINH